MPLPDEDLLDKHFPDDERGRNKARSAFGIIAIVLVVIFMAGIGLVYFMTGKAAPTGELPVIAETSPPERVKPEDPGGMEIPHQDATVYDQVGAQQGAAAPEKLLPEPEAPMDAAAVNAEINPGVPTPEVAPEKLETTPETQKADIPTELKGLPPASEQTSEPPAVAPVEAKTKESAPAQVTEEKGLEVTPQPKAAETATTDFRIQLGAVKDEALAQTEWSRISKKFPEALKDLQPFYAPVNLGEKGIYLRIQTNAMSQPDAEARCTKLKAGNQACLIVRAVK